MPQNKQKNGIKRSATGHYSFRKQVPEKLRAALGKREVKVKLETKDEAVALARSAQVLSDFNATARLLAKSLERGETLSVAEVTLMADKRLRGWSVHPEQAPVLKAGHTKAEYEEFKAKEQEYLQLRDLYFDVSTGNLVDEEQQQRDYDSGLWGNLGYQVPYKKPDVSTVSGAAYNIASGNIISTNSPTLNYALVSYIADYEERNYGGNARTVQSAKTNTKRVLTQLASFIEGGRPSEGFKRLVSSITVEEAIGFRDHLRKQHPNSGTADTNLRYPSAVFSHIIEKGQGLYIGSHLMRNPFHKLRNKKREEQLAKKKWPLNPDEFRKYEAAADQAEIHVKLLILFLLYTGCRVSDAFGLEVRDVNLTENIPTMYLRHNGIRRLDKDGIQANVPLVGLVRV